MTNTQKQRRLAGKEEVAESQEEYQELRVGSSMLTGQDDSNSLESLTETVREKRKPRQAFLFRVWKFLQVTATGVIKGDKPSHLDLELPQRYWPSNIPGLCQATGFTPMEIKKMYCSFKNECPTGLVNKETFHAIYSKFFPTGANLSSYSHYVFSAMDQQNTGVVTFEDFAVGVSILLKGTLEDRLRWTFQVYDVNKDGVLSRAEVREVTAAIHDLMGHPNGERQKSEANDQMIDRRAERAFQRMDIDQDGVITLEEFLTSCLEDKKMTQSFDSVHIVENM